jgi:hypothetical protein
MSDDTHAMLRAILMGQTEHAETFDTTMQNLAAAIQALAKLIEDGFQEVLTALDGNGNGEDGK